MRSACHRLVEADADQRHIGAAPATPGRKTFPVASTKREWMPDDVAAAYVGGLVGIPLLAALLSYLTGAHIALAGAVLYLPWLFLVAPKALGTPEASHRSVRVFGGLALVPVIAAVIDLTTPVPFTSALVPVFIAWATTLVPRNQSENRADQLPTRKGIRPVRFRWLAGWSVVAVIAVPLVLAFLFL